MAIGGVKSKKTRSYQVRIPRIDWARTDYHALLLRRLGKSIYFIVSGVYMEY